MSALEQLHTMVGKNENILWSGKPNLKCFILESIFNPLLPFALIWALFDGFFIFMLTHGASHTKTPVGLAIPLVAFFALHLMPVWIYLGGVLLSYLRYKHTAFLVTDKGIYTSGGTFSLTYEHKPFMEISHVNLRRGIIDQFLGVGDITFANPPETASPFRSRNPLATNVLAICDIPDYQQVYAMVKELQQDIYADTQYPNDLRPKENHGYHTSYTPENKQ